MAFVAVTDYEVGWNVRGDQSKLLIKLQDGESFSFTPRNPAGVLAVLRCCKERKPISGIGMRA